jgi:hypothetical protein
MLASLVNSRSAVLALTQYTKVAFLKHAQWHALTKLGGIDTIYLDIAFSLTIISTPSFSGWLAIPLLAACRPCWSTNHLWLEGGREERRRVQDLSEIGGLFKNADPYTLRTRASPRQKRFIQPPFPDPTACILVGSVTIDIATSMNIDNNQKLHNTYFTR